MDGKGGAEELMGKLMQDEALLKALTSAPKQEDETADEAPGTEDPANG